MRDSILQRPVAGHVWLKGKSVTQMREQIGYMPQRHSVDWNFPTTARDVVEMGLYRSDGWFRRPGPSARARLIVAQICSDWRVMQNVRVIAQGPVRTVHSPEKLRAAYGRQRTNIAPPLQEAAQ